MARRLRPIPSTGGRYLAGDDGTIWSRGWRCAKLHRMTPQLKRSDGYAYVQTHVDGADVRRPVHRLVAEAWCPEWCWVLEVHHINGDRTDNRAENLTCLTPAEHRRIHGDDVTDADIANSLYDCEIKAKKPMPSPYEGKGKRYKKYSRKDSKATYLHMLIRQADNVAADIERHQRKMRRLRNGRDEGAEQAPALREQELAAQAQARGAGHGAHAPEQEGATVPEGRHEGS